jgi:acyl-coenzyme A synthetase/AMP-(fatty) acid ligase
MHMGSNLCIWKSLALGGCLVLPTDIPYPATELSRMIDQCGLTKLVIFPPLLSIVFRQADTDPLLLERLQKLHAIMYAGMALDAADERWAHDRGICPVNLFGSTETGFALCSRSTIEDSAYLEPFPSSAYEFIPLQNGPDSDVRLLELVIPPESPDCPAESLRSLDGKFHTGDLFIQAGPGRYLPKGRADNWMKMETGLRCDTGSVEANVMQTCAGDLIHTAVVAGAGRPSPVLIVEPRDEIACTSDGSLSRSPVEKLTKDIFQRITPFHQRRYRHERIDDARFILVVQKGSLPRTTTKGNIRKKEVEQLLKDQLDQIYHN